MTTHDDDDMALPAGKTCGDCRHFTRTCEWLISCKPTNTRCDWAPSRFVAAPAVQDAPQPRFDPTEECRMERTPDGEFVKFKDHCARVRELRAALKRLTFAARTSGGTAGRDEELCAACDQAEAALTAAPAVADAPPPRDDSQWIRRALELAAKECDAIAFDEGMLGEPSGYASQCAAAVRALIVPDAAPPAADATPPERLRDIDFERDDVHALPAAPQEDAPLLATLNDCLSHQHRNGGHLLSRSLIERTIAALAEKDAALRERDADAERYRWLRSIGADRLNVIAHYAGESLDAAIDAALGSKGATE